MKSTIESTIPFDENQKLFRELDKGIGDTENGRVTPHEKSIEILIQRYNNKHWQSLQSSIDHFTTDCLTEEIEPLRVEECEEMVDSDKNQ